MVRQIDWIEEKRLYDDVVDVGGVPPTGPLCGPQRDPALVRLCQGFGGSR